MRRLNESSNRKMLILRCFSSFFLWGLASGNVYASFSSAFSEAYHTLSNNVARTWSTSEHYELYIPSITWHARFAYDQEKSNSIMNARGGPVLASLVRMRKATGMVCT